MSTNTFSQMLETRPARLPRAMEQSRAKIAGVCEGLGFRFQIDPLLLRVIFFVSAFTGIGPLLYITLWWLMPRYPLDVSPAQALMQYPKSGRQRTQLRLGAWAGLFFLALGWLSALVIIPFFAITAVVVTGIVWWLLFLRTPEQPAELDAELRSQASIPAHRRRWPWVTAASVLAVGAIGGAVLFSSPLMESNYTKVEDPKELQAEYTTDFGSMNLDLQDLKPLQKPQTVEVRSRYGNAGVILPDTAYRLECQEDAAGCNDSVHQGKGALLTIKLSAGRFGEAWTE
ncbi:PspC domain-containing protein [Corynebacterium gerontici]|nr:PspC domain-containing protein [Corynebacterium gerontici]